jgi:diguanylate cyclase (GGDEF)-like protein
VALAMIDIDHFKRINDGHGHAVGDAVLQKMAEVARAGMRVGDVLARWGGEEFLLLMPHTAPADAALVLQRFRESMAEAGFDGLAPGLTVTFSAGLTQIEPHESHEAAIERADRALYRAKHAGRDRTEHG